MQLGRRALDLNIKPGGAQLAFGAYNFTRMFKNQQAPVVAAAFVRAAFASAGMTATPCTGRRKNTAQPLGKPAQHSALWLAMHHRFSKCCLPA